MCSSENNKKRVTWEGCSVLLDINDGDRLVFARLSPAAKLKIGNKNCSLQPLIGCPFGTVFQLDTSSDGAPFLSPFQPKGNINNTEDIKDGRFQAESKDGPLTGELRDNRSLIDNNTAQSLTGEDIEDMRRQGAKGDEIIEALIANSATFDKKTSFSQEKYRLKFSDQTLTLIFSIDSIMEKPGETIAVVLSAKEAFEKLEKVGEGTYGKVYRAREKATGKIVALKKTRLHEDDEGVPPTTLREVSILRMLSRDPHVVRLLDVKQGQNKEGKTVLYLVFEYMDTDLKKFIRSFRQTGQNIPPPTIKGLMYQLCKGVAFCHGHGILHRDLKPHNLLMDRKTMMLKIADLGLARAFTVPLKKYTHEILTLWYRAPEVLLGATHYSMAVDMWSVACIFAELVTKTALFPGDSELQQLLHIFRLLGTPNEDVWPGVSKLMNWHEYPQWGPQSLSKAVPGLEETGVDLLSQMLQYEPSKRLSAKKAMEHPYFDDLDKTYL